MPIINQKQMDGRNQLYAGARHTIGVSKKGTAGARLSNTNNQNNSIHDSYSNLTFNANGCIGAAGDSSIAGPSRKRFNVDMVENLNMSWDSGEE